LARASVKPTRAFDRSYSSHPQAPQPHGSHLHAVLTLPHWQGAQRQGLQAQALARAVSAVWFSVVLVMVVTLPFVVGDAYLRSVPWYGVKRVLKMFEDMTIARLAGAAGVGVETVRYYQRRGLLPTPKKRSGAYRTYGEGDLERLIFIRRAQSAGFSLEEIQELLSLDRSNDKKRVRELARERLVALDLKITELREAQAALTKLLGVCEKRSAGPCPIIEAFLPA
jgi:MerR family mercuric resistance operon transcriptional regulator